MIELTKIMWQKDDHMFIATLNRIRTALQTEDDIELMQSRSVTPADPNHPRDALHIWAENAPVDEHNRKKLEELPARLFVVKANDKYPANIGKQDIDRVLQRNRSETGGIDFMLKKELE